MPLLFLLLIILAVRAVTLTGALSGLKKINPNIEHVKSTMFLDAIVQTFFSLSISMGCLITYGSYFNNKINITKTAVHVSVPDTLVAIISIFIYGIG